MYICNIIYYSMISGKFAITTHILVLLSKFPNDYLSSEFIASSINLNAVLVRKEISNLKSHHIVESKEGKNGGSKLAIHPSLINMKAIFDMTLDTVSLGFSKNTPNPNCPVGKKINENLTTLYQNINQKVSLELEQISLEDFADNF